MRIKTRRSQRIRTITIWTISTLLAISGALAGYKYMTRETGPIPPSIRSQLTFSPFVLPNKTKKYTTSDYKFDTAEDKVRILSYVIQLKDNSITVSEYAQPPEFDEIPEYKDRFLSNVTKQYAAVQTSNGTIYLGRLPKQGNKQLAIMIEKGLLVLMSPNQDIEESQWRSLGDQLEVQKIVD